MQSSISPLPSKNQIRIDLTRTCRYDILRTEFINQSYSSQEKISAGEVYDHLYSSIGSIRYKGMKYVFDHRSLAYFKSPPDIPIDRPVVCNPNHFLYFGRTYVLWMTSVGRYNAKFWFKSGKTEKRKTSMKVDLTVVNEEDDYEEQDISNVRLKISPLAWGNFSHNYMREECSLRPIC